MAWHNYFDNIYVIHLDSRLDRREHIVQEMSQYSIPFTFVSAKNMDDPKEGLYETIRERIQRSLDAGEERILNFEDDAEFLRDPNEIMEEVVGQLQEVQWDICYLGINHPTKFQRFQSKNLIPVHEAYSTHAIAFSKTGMIRFLKMPKELPVDVAISKHLLQSHCYCTYPMLVTQKDGYSDILKKNVQYSKYLESRYDKNIQHLIT